MTMRNELPLVRCFGSLSYMIMLFAVRDDHRFIDVDLERISFGILEFDEFRPDIDLILENSDHRFIGIERID